MMLRSYRPQRFWATNSTFPCDHQKSTGLTQIDVLRDVIVQTFLFVLQPVSRALQVETKI